MVACLRYPEHLGIANITRVVLLILFERLGGSGFKDTLVLLRSETHGRFRSIYESFLRFSLVSLISLHSNLDIALNPLPGILLVLPALTRVSIRLSYHIHNPPFPRFLLGNNLSDLILCLLL